MAARSRVVKLPVPSSLTENAAPPLAPQVGRVISVARAGRVLIEYDAALGPIPARYVAAVPIEQLRQAAEQGREALVVFEGQDRQKPIVIGLLAPEESSEPSALPAAPGTTEAMARVDGKRVRVTAEDEIVLECGEASITLRRNGRVVIRGAYVETRSRGTNRIKGGNVRIN